MKKYFLYSFIILLIGANAILCQQNPSLELKKVENTRVVKKDFTREIDKLLSQMTLEEKVGQLVQVVGAGKFHSDFIRNGNIGSLLIGVQGAEEANKWQRIAVEESRLGIPLLFANDVIHGYNTIFPIPLAEAASWNPELIEEASRIAAIEAAAEGTHWTYAPMVDIARDPRWGRIMEGSGEDPYLGSVLAAARVKGFQGDDISKPQNIAACAKHYVAYGAAEGGKDYNTVDISEKVLREIYLPPFKAAVDAGVETFMSAFNEISGVPASANKFTLRNILRDEWGFDGIVISDYNSIGELLAHGIAADKKEAAFRGLDAGVDIDMVGDSLVGNIYMPHLADLVNEGKISLELLESSVREVLDLKFKLGLFDNPYVNTEYYNENMPSQVERDKVAHKIAQESLVPLKNEKDILPISKNIKSIALIGPLADNQPDLLGSWACDGKDSNVVTIIEGIKSKIGKETKINFVKGCEILDDEPSDIDEAVKAANNSEIAILAVGEGKWQSGEAASRSNIDLPGRQLELIQKVYETGTPTVVVLLNGRPLSINWTAENIPAVLEAWYLGDQAGLAIADVLFGDYNPSGKLPVTFPRSVGQIPIYYNYKNTGRPPTQYKYTAKYIDEQVTPLFPFGFGLSYSNFEYSDIALSKKESTNDEELYASLTIKNNSEIAGQEIVQLYIRDVVGSVTRPVKELKGFQKLHLNPGEVKEIRFTVTSDMLTFYNAESKLIIEPGQFEVMIGTSSEDYLKESFWLK